jgi:polyhydroxyalkanoate synthase
MAPPVDPGELLERIRHEMQRSALAVRNGIRYVTQDPPAVGQSSKDMVWSRDKARLWRYSSDTVTYQPPVLIVHSLVSRSYIFDLTPTDSFVGRLRDAGFDVFLVDWGVPDEIDAGNGLETYVDEYLPGAVRAALRESGSEQVSVIGYCLGAVLACLFAARHPDFVRNMAAMATPANYTDLGLFARLFHDGRLEPDDVIDDTGNVPPDVIYNAFWVQKPTGELANYAGLWQNLWHDEFVEGFQRMTQWVRDHIPFPGAAFRQTIAMLCRDNALVEGTVRLGGQRVDLTEIRCPFLNIYGAKDNIVTPDAARPLIGLVGSDDREELVIPGGHAAMVTGRQAAKVTMPGIVDWLRRHSDAITTD